MTEIVQNEGIPGRIARHYAKLSVSHRRVADIIAASPHQAALMTLEQMAAEAKLSKATVNRFGGAIGFDGYKAVRAHLRDELALSLSPVERLAETLDAGASPWRRSLADDAERVRRVEAVGGDPAFARAVQRIMHAERVYLVGFGSSAFLADYAAFCLSSLRSGCTSVADGAGFEGASRKILDAGPADVALQIGFARYSRDNVRVARRLYAQKVPIVAITDSPASPFAAMADACFLVSRSPSFALSGGGTGAMAVIEALLRSIGAALGAGPVRARAARLTSALGDAVVASDQAADK